MTQPRHVLIVDDEPSLLFTLSDRLETEGYRVDAERTGDAGLARASSETFDVIILDGMLPGRDGLDVCQTLRQRGVRTPILMLSARAQLIDRVVGLKLGADDYLTKPFEISELLARLQALLRRVPQTDLQIFQFGDVVIDYRQAEVTRGGVKVELTAREYTLLTYFVKHQGAAISRDELLNQVWGYTAMPSTRTVDVHIAILRQKLETHPRKPRHIVTVFGLGYKFVV